MLARCNAPGNRAGDLLPARQGNLGHCTAHPINGNLQKVCLADEVSDKSVDRSLVDVARAAHLLHPAL